MENNSRSFGKLLRDTTRSGGDRLGHGIGNVRSRVGRGAALRSERRGSGPLTDSSGNTSETGVSTPELGGADNTNPVAPRSPLSPGMGCSKPAGTMFIATVSLLAAGIKRGHR